jgi:Na+-translocating ferredoxin:NAD+ oxidoreductase RnfA subunit
MGLAVVFVMGLASAICYVVNAFILVPLGLAFLKTLAFILVIAALVQFVEMFLKKMVPSLYSALGIFLPLITTNCAVLGVVLLNVQNNYNFIESLVYGITGGIGFLLAIVLLPACVSAWSLPIIPSASRASPSALFPQRWWPWPSWASAAWPSRYEEVREYDNDSSCDARPRRAGRYLRRAACLRLPDLLCEGRSQAGCGA